MTNSKNARMICRPFLRFAVAYALAVVSVTSPVTAQQSPPTPTPPGPAAITPKGAAPAKPAAERTITLTPTRPGTYSYWTIGGKGEQSSPGSLGAGEKSATVSVPSGVREIYVLDETSGMVAVLPIPKGNALSVSPDAFNRVRSVVVSVTGNGGKPVEKAAITLTTSPASTQQRVLTAADEGKARFENIPVGKATVTAAYGSGNAEKVTQETAITPAKGGGPTQVTLALSGNVPTLDVPVPVATATTPVPPGFPSPSAPAAPAEPPRNDWVAGFIGLLLLGAGGFYGLRYARNRGMTVPGVLKQMGVEMPQDAQESPLGHLRPASATPGPSSVLPLPSLADLPAAGAAPAAVALGQNGAATPSSGPPRLVGLSGVVAGETFPLEPGAAFTVGREDGNALALTSENTISRRHARFEPGGSNGWSVVDNGSSNGTYVNGTRIKDATPLRPGDEVQIGAARFRYDA